MKKALILLIVLSMFIPINACAQKPSKASDSSAQSDQVSGKNPAPDFELTDLNTGKKIKLSDFKGKVVVLDFWATWCPPCRAEIPGFIALQNKYSKQGFTMFGVAIDDVSRVKPFYKQNKMNYPVAIGSRDVANLYGGVQGIPTTFVIDKAGNIARKYVGYRPDTMFEADFKALK